MQPFGARAHLVLSPLGIAHLERFEVDSAGLRFVDRIQEKRQLLHVGPAARAAYRRIDEDDTVYGIGMLVRKPGRDPRPQRMTHHRIPLELERGRERGDIGRIGIQRIVQIRTGLGQPAPTKVQHKRIAQAPEAFADEVPGRGRIGDAGQHDQRRAFAAVPQVVLANAVRADISAIKAGAF